MRLYLSGPMTGLPELNYPAFRSAARHLRGIEVVREVYNPAEWEDITRQKFDLHLAFSHYCEYIIWNADKVVVLPGWENSPGATAETALAKALGKPVVAYSPLTGFASLDNTEDHPTLFTH